MVGICWLAVGGIREMERNDYAMGGFVEILRHYSFRTPDTGTCECVCGSSNRQSGDPQNLGVTQALLLALATN